VWLINKPWSLRDSRDSSSQLLVAPPSDRILLQFVRACERAVAQVTAKILRSNDPWRWSERAVAVWLLLLLLLLLLFATPWQSGRAGLGLARSLSV
jgi:hypothetical protein